MNKIKRILKRPQLIMEYLIDIGYFNWLNDKCFLELKYKLKIGEKLNLDNPQTFNEKIQWLKLYNKKPKYTMMVDKYEVKKYVADKIGQEYIIPTLGVYDSEEDIDFNKLPNKFVLKCTHDSGGLCICKDKSKLDIEKAKKRLKKSLRKNYYYSEREWPYKNVEPRVIVEQYMGTEEQEELIDYKFFCFNGVPQYIYISEGLSNHTTAKISFADMDYNLTFNRDDYKPFEKLPPKPINFEKMKELAKELSKGIPFVRVDFYEINNKIYFGELTFYPGAGYIPFNPIEYDQILGDMLELPKYKTEEKK